MEVAGSSPVSRSILPKILSGFVLAHSAFRRTIVRLTPSFARAAPERILGRMEFGERGENRGRRRPVDGELPGGQRKAAEVAQAEEERMFRRALGRAPCPAPKKAARPKGFRRFFYLDWTR